MDTSLPAAFDATSEPNKVLAKAKASVSKKFSWTKSQPLFDTLDLAVLLLVYGREQEALEVCQTLGKLQFNGSFNLWGAAERALTLEARILRSRGESEEADNCVQRVRDAGYVDTRLEGSLLDRNGLLEESLKNGKKKWEFEARKTRASELAFIIELGGSAKLPIAKAEQDWEENMAAMRQLAGADK